MDDLEKDVRSVLNTSVKFGLINLEPAKRMVKVRVVRPDFTYSDKWWVQEDYLSNPPNNSFIVE